MATKSKGLFGDSDAIRQLLLWQVAGQLIAPILAPVAQTIANRVWEGATSAGGGIVSVPLSPSEAALGVLRGNIDEGTGKSIAGKSGVDGDDFDRMVANTGEPISIEQALFLFRRGKIEQARLVQAIRESRVRNEWVPEIEMLNDIPLSVADAVQAVVEEQITYPAGVQIASWGGVSEPDFRILVNTRGRPPGIEQVVELVRRGIVPAKGTGPDATTLEQAVHESDVKTKWEPAIQALLDYIPPPRTVTALLRAGSITQAQALDLFHKAGLSTELAAAYVADASHAKVATEKQLTKDQVTQLYTERLITKDQATSMLAALHYTAPESALILQLGDLQRHQRVYNAGITRIGTLYIGRKLEAAAASAALDSLGVPAAQRDEYLTVWALERAANLKILSEATIATAWKYGAITDQDALSMVEAHGYTPFDAWVFLAAHNKGAGPGPMPARDSVHAGL
jgi:hypothetical protein